MSVFHVTYDRLVIQNSAGFKRQRLETKTEKFKTFQAAVAHARFLKSSGVASNLPLIEEKN
jgi:hypothetical protein